QIQHFADKAGEQAATLLREKAAEVSSVFASELNHASRNFVGHAQQQMEEVVRDSFERARALFSDAAVLFGGLFGGLRVELAHFLLMSLRNGLPGFEKRPKACLHPLIHFVDAGIQRALHCALETEQEIFLLGGELLRQIRVGRIDLAARGGGGLLDFGFEAAELLPRLALNFVDEGGGGGVRGIAEKGAGALEGIADHLFHLLLRVTHEIAAGVTEFTGKYAGDFGSLLAKERGGLFAGFIGKVLDLSLRFLLVPLRGLE